MRWLTAGDVFKTKLAEFAGETMKAIETKSMVQQVRLSCGCRGVRAAGWDGTTEPVFQVGKPCDEHREAFARFLHVFVALNADEDVTPLD